MHDTLKENVSIKARRPIALQVLQIHVNPSERGAGAHTLSQVLQTQHTQDGVLCGIACRVGAENDPGPGHLAPTHQSGRMLSVEVSI